MWPTLKGRLLHPRIHVEILALDDLARTCVEHVYCSHDWCATCAQNTVGIIFSFDPTLASSLSLLYQQDWIVAMFATYRRYTAWAEHNAACKKYKIYFEIECNIGCLEFIKVKQLDCLKSLWLIASCWYANCKYTRTQVRRVFCTQQTTALPLPP